MSTYISMLRGINVAGQRKLHMQDLREIYEGLGFSSVRTYVQSGNVVFEAKVTKPNELVKPIETAIESSCGYPVKVFIRQPNELQRVLNENPFLSERNEDPRWLHVTFLYHSPAEEEWKKITAQAGIPDKFARGRDVIYLFCPNGYGTTKLSNSFFERKLGVPATTRNWNTVNALYKMVMVV
ncbi:MAG: hypothetical protein A2136_07935 [Chloroflexi bacterium RBG_16_54_11]|nr:MAG: hypothetical protein A2136_07935 [Chloroflexi bacterium RBG_16_54_11]